MLLEFTVGNYLSFKDKKTLSLEAAPITECPENVIESGDFKVLRSAVIYGANSSGKSNLLSALAKMKTIVVDSGKNASTDRIDVFPFLLNTDTEASPSYFEVLFLIDKIRYRYGFEVDENKVHAEWLFMLTSDKKKETLLFIRDRALLEVSKAFKEGEGLEQRTRENGLYLSTVDQFNGEISKLIMKWFSSIRVLSGLEHETKRGLSLDLLSDPSFENDIKKFVDAFNLGFESIEFEGERDDFRNGSVATFHKKFDENGNFVENVRFSLNYHESSGTNKLFDMAGYIYCGLRLGNTVIIDELDAKMHPILTQAMVKLFHNPENNPENAQLIFVTHDTNLLNRGGFRRDQIFFTEKNQYEETDLYSLVEYKDANDVKIRKDSSFEKDYINGRYGAIPFIGDLSFILKNEKAN